MPAFDLREISKRIGRVIGYGNHDPPVGTKIRVRGRLIENGFDRIPIDLGEMDLVELLGLGFEAEECGGVADIAEEEEGCDGGDEEANCDDFVEILRDPCREIEAFGFREATIWMESW